MPNVNQALFAQLVRTHSFFKVVLANQPVMSNTTITEDTVPDVLLDVLHVPQPHNVNNVNQPTFLVTESVPQDALMVNTSLTEPVMPVNLLAQLVLLLILVHHVPPTYSSPLTATVCLNAQEDSSEPMENARLVILLVEIAQQLDLIHVSPAQLDYSSHKIAVFNSAPMVTTMVMEFAHHATQLAPSAETLTFVPHVLRDSSTTESV